VHDLGLAFVLTAVQLKSLDISGCHQLTDRTLHLLSQKQLSLKHLAMRRVARVSSNAIDALCSGVCSPQLTTLDLSGCNLSDCALQQLKSMSSLRSLSLAHSKHMRGSGLADIDCGGLELLDLRGCSSLTTTALHSLIDKCGRRLLKVFVPLCPAIDDSILAHLGTTCTNLHVLDVYGCSQLSDEGLLELARQCVTLVQLNIAFCPRITTEGVIEATGL